MSRIRRYLTVIAGCLLGAVLACVWALENWPSTHLIRIVQAQDSYSTVTRSPGGWRPELSISMWASSM